MTNQELINHLSKYDPNTEIDFIMLKYSGITSFKIVDSYLWFKENKLEIILEPDRNECL
jgi:hypothetical protein